MNVSPGPVFTRPLGSVAAGAVCVLGAGVTGAELGPEFVITGGGVDVDGAGVGAVGAVFGPDLNG